MSGKIKCGTCGTDIRQGNDFVKIEVYEGCIFKQWMALCNVCGCIVLNDTLPKMKKDFESSVEMMRVGMALDLKERGSEKSS
jgi:hypothetical protein